MKSSLIFYGCSQILNYISKMFLSTPLGQILSELSNVFLHILNSSFSRASVNTQMFEETPSTEFTFFFPTGVWRYQSQPETTTQTVSSLSQHRVCSPLYIRDVAQNYRSWTRYLLQEFMELLGYVHCGCKYFSNTVWFLTSQNLNQT